MELEELGSILREKNVFTVRLSELDDYAKGKKRVPISIQFVPA